jgi:transcriptional regulator with AAA-type ATPase domain
MAKNILITWHYTTHGIGFLKHVLATFMQHKGQPKSNFCWEEKDPTEMHAFFENVPYHGFRFDEILYLTAPQETFNRLSNRRKYRRDMLDDDIVKKEGVTEVWKALFEKVDVRDPAYVPSLEEDLRFVEKHFPKKKESFERTLWRDIHHYNIEEQIKWFKTMSNAQDKYGEKLTEIPLDLNNLRDITEIAECLQKELRPRLKDKHNYFINISLGSSETQVVWHLLGQAHFLPPNTRFFSTYDDKRDTTNRRHKHFNVLEVPVDIFDKSKPKPLFENTKSDLRQIAALKMKHFLTMGFSILILGERGTGKSHLIEEYKSEKKIVSANCAAFDSDSKAESELFGYKKGAFTGAQSDKDGLFHEAANGGILFLDEVHQLSKAVQGKLMKALQTDQHNYFHIRRMGALKEEPIRCTVIFASNKSLKELREEHLLPDFYDRIAQNIVELPSLRDTPEDRLADWKRIWKQLRFVDEAPQYDAFLEWLEKEPLPGNYRDLQRIAIWWKSFDDFEEDLKELLEKKGVHTPFEYVKHEAQKQVTDLQEESASYFSLKKTIKEMEQHFKKDLAQWLNSKFGSMAKASEYFAKEFGESITKETLYRWKNAK